MFQDPSAPAEIVRCNATILQSKLASYRCSKQLAESNEPTLPMRERVGHGRDAAEATLQATLTWLQKFWAKVPLQASTTSEFSKDLGQLQGFKPLRKGTEERHP